MSQSVESRLADLQLPGLYGICLDPGLRTLSRDTGHCTLEARNALGQLIACVNVCKHVCSTCSTNYYYTIRIMMHVHVVCEFP